MSENFQFSDHAQKFPSEISNRASTVLAEVSAVLNPGHKLSPAAESASGSGDRASKMRMSPICQLDPAVGKLGS